jgi:hypothetical protein
MAEENWSYLAEYKGFIKPDQIALLIDLGFSVHKRINVALWQTTWKKEDEQLIKKFVSDFMIQANNKLVYRSFQPNQKGQMQGIIFNRNNISLNAALLGNDLMKVSYEEEE